MYIDIYMMYNIWFSVWLSTISTCTCSFSLVYHLYTSCIHQWLHNSSNLKLFGGEGGFNPTCLLLKNNACKCDSSSKYMTFNALYEDLEQFDWFVVEDDSIYSVTLWA